MTQLATPVNGVVLMSPDEARSCVRAINRSMEHARELLLDLYEREGWRALGYRNWRECATREFKQSQAYLYRQLKAATIEREISPMGEKPAAAINERQLRPLAALDTAEERREVWAEAVATAPDGEVTERHVRLAVTRHQAQQDSAPTPPRQPLRATTPMCPSCLAYTNPDNWYVTDTGVWVWAGSDAPPHLRAISSQQQEGEAL